MPMGRPVRWRSGARRVRHPDAPQRARSAIFCALVFGVAVARARHDAPSFAAPAITLNKSAPADVLVGGSVHYTLSASNPSSNPDAVPEYNVVVPRRAPRRCHLRRGQHDTDGLRRAAGDRRPRHRAADADLEQRRRPGTWLLDLAVLQRHALGRRLPRGLRRDQQRRRLHQLQPAEGAEVHRLGRAGTRSSYTESASDLASTHVSALRLQKSEPSPEGELLRGVHDHTTVYTLTVTNNHGAATTGAGVVDLIPAGLEFLGCGGVDNTTTGPEYPGAPSLAATPTRAELPDARLGQHRRPTRRGPGGRLHPRDLDARQPRARPGGRRSGTRPGSPARQHRDVDGPTPTAGQPRPDRQPRQQQRPVDPRDARSSRPTPTMRRSPATTPARSHPGTDPQVSCHATPRPSASEDVRMRKTSRHRDLRRGRRPALHADRSTPASTPTRPTSW